MARRRVYNPNTQYGRNKMREQNREILANMTPEDRSKYNGCLVLIFVIIVIAVILFGVLTGNEKGAIKWLSR